MIYVFIVSWYVRLCTDNDNEKTNQSNLGLKEDTGMPGGRLGVSYLVSNTSCVDR